MKTVRVVPAVVVIALVATSARLSAQDTTLVTTDSSAVSDSSAFPLADSITVRVPSALSAAQLDSLRAALRPVSPMGAFWRSLLIPGWGQAKLNRKLTGALFLTFEGVALGMSLKASKELDYLRRSDSQRSSKKRDERTDWLVLIAFNHLFSAMEGYVSSHLWDFPGDLQLRALPGGRVGPGVSLPIRIP
jgi:hypothetical protein